MTTVVAVVGTIAGAGTTTVATVLGSALGEQRRRVALVDATDEGSRIADALAIERSGDLADALRRGTAVGDVQGSGPHDLAAFPAEPGTSWGSMRPDAVATLYDQLRERFEFVLVDCGSSPSPASAAWLGHADEAVIVTDPDVAGAVPELVALAGAFDVPVRGALANRVPPKEVGDAIEALRETDQSVLGVLPEDPTVGVAADAGVSVLRTEPDSLIATCAWEFALRFRQADHDEPVVPQGTGPPPNAGDGVDDDADDETGDEEAEDRAGADGAGDEVDGREDGSTAAAASPEPAAAADAGTTPATGSTSPTESNRDDRSDDTSGRSDDAPGSEDEASGSAETDDGPVESTAPTPGSAGSSTPIQHESDESAATTSGNGDAEEADREDGASGDADDGAPADPSGGAGDGPGDESANAEPLDGLLGDVRERVGSAGRPGDASTATAEREEESADAGSASEEDEASAELSDDEIEAVFKETMDRVKERREQEETDGEERDD